jgi:Ca2+-binding RTX toxin-like protein
VVVDLSVGVASTDGDGGHDTLISLEYVRGSEFNDSIAGNDDHNRIEGRAGNEDIAGGDGWDTLAGGAGNDTLAGGEGFDDVSFFDSKEGVTVDLTIQDGIQRRSSAPAWGATS